MSFSPLSRRALRIALGFLLIGIAALTAMGADPVVVILNDGFVIQGPYTREMDTMSDANGRSIKVAKIDGFDIVQDGPKYVIFSTHSQRGAKIEKEVGRPKYTAYTTKLQRRLGRQVLAIHKIVKTTELDDRWTRRLDTITTENQPQTLTQQLTTLDPYSFVLDSSTDAITVSYHTSEEDPARIRKWLSLHPDLKDVGGKVDPERRLKIATFLKDVGTLDATRRQVLWLQIARQELEKLKTDAPPPWSKPVTEQADKLQDDIDKAETRLVVDELEAALRSGRYDAARKFLAGFSPKGTDAMETTRISIVKARIDAMQPKYEDTVRLLRRVIERESGMATIQTHSAAFGVVAGLFAPRPKLTKEMATLLDAGSVILDELHPDTAGRLELFHDLAKQSEQQRVDGKEPSEKSEALLAYAISGWLKGKNGADKSVESAMRCWATRQLAINYLREGIGNNRKILLDGYRKETTTPLAPDELSQIITLLPPTLPMDLQNPTWKPISKDLCSGVDGVVRMNTGPLPETGKGVDYCLRLPPEYHHGRSYPVVLALPSSLLGAEQMVAGLAEQAERNGYIIISPEWTNQFSTTGYDFSGKDHYYALAALRDALRRFQIDPDKVFLFGFSEGANFALDLGMSHPDLFAGLVGFGPNPPPPLMLEYWRNTQKLPTYFVTGELTGSFPNLRKVYEKWMPKGYPAILTLYRGRSLEWFPVEIPRIFDWMNRKSRVRGTASLRLNQFGVEPWQVLRETDDRYYWVGVGANGISQSNPLSKGVPSRVNPPPQFAADIGKAGVITITQAIGIRKFVIWLERDLIDWTKPIRISINGQPPPRYKPQILKPDLHLMLEELYRTGDRKMLFLGKIEVDWQG